MGEEQGRGPEVRARRAVGRTEPDERHGDGVERRGHEERGGDRLRIEKVRDDEEIAEEGGRRRIAMRARLEDLEAREQHEEEDARLAAEERAVLEPYREHRHRR